MTGSPRVLPVHALKGAPLGVSIAHVSQIEHGEVATVDVIARHVEALDGRLDLVADFGDHTLRIPASGDQGSAAA